MYDEGPGRTDCPPGNQRSNMKTKDARLLCQLIVEVYTAPSDSLMSNQTHVTEENPRISYLDCLEIDRVDSVYSNSNTQ